MNFFKRRKDRVTKEEKLTITTTPVLKLKPFFSLETGRVAFCTDSYKKYHVERFYDEVPENVLRLQFSRSDSSTILATIQTINYNSQSSTDNLISLRLDGCIFSKKRFSRLMFRVIKNCENLQILQLWKAPTISEDTILFMYNLMKGRQAIERKINICFSTKHEKHYRNKVGFLIQHIVMMSREYFVINGSSSLNNRFFRNILTGLEIRKRTVMVEKNFNVVLAVVRTKINLRVMKMTNLSIETRLKSNMLNNVASYTWTVPNK